MGWTSQRFTRDRRDFVEGADEPQMFYLAVKCALNVQQRFSKCVHSQEAVLSSRVLMGSLGAFSRASWPAKALAYTELIFRTRRRNLPSARRTFALRSLT